MVTRRRALHAQQRTWAVRCGLVLGFLLGQQEIECVSSASIQFSANTLDSSHGSTTCNRCCPLGMGRALSPRGVCACVWCVDGQNFSNHVNEETCSPCNECPKHVVVSWNCNKTGDIKCVDGTCEVGYSWNKIAEECFRTLETTPFSAGSQRKVTETSQLGTSSRETSTAEHTSTLETGTTVAASRLETGNTVAASRLETGNTVAASILETGTTVAASRLETGSTVAAVSDSSPIQPWSHFHSDDEDNRKTMVVAAVAAACSLLVVILSVTAVLLKWRPCRQQSVPDKIKTVGDLPESMRKMVGRELANRNNPANYRNLLGALDVDHIQIRALDSILSHGAIDEFSLELFSALDKLEQPVTVLQLCDTLKKLDAGTLALDILQRAKELKLKLDEFDDLDQAVEDCYKILTEQRVNSRSPAPEDISSNDPRPEMVDNFPGMYNEIRHTMSTDELTSTSDEDEDEDGDDKQSLV